MTEAEWNTSTDPEAMYQIVENGAFKTGYGVSPKTTRRRVFFGAACCRLVWPWIEVDPRCVQMIDFIENQFDTELSKDERERLKFNVHMAAEEPEADTSDLQYIAANLVSNCEIPFNAIRYLLLRFKMWGDVSTRAAQISDIMRCIIGNPFRPVTLLPEWRTSTVLALAEGIYAERAFDRLPILADALEEAGCDHADMLNHCRGPGAHVRGCWVVDLVLGKE